MSWNVGILWLTRNIRLKATIVLTNGKNVLKVTVVRNMSGRYQTLTLGSDPSGKIERLKVYSKKETIMR